MFFDLADVADPRSALDIEYFKPPVEQLVDSRSVLGLRCSST
jgi:hypothetical protein